MRYHTKNRKQSNSLFLNKHSIARVTICIPRFGDKKDRNSYNFPVIALLSLVSFIWWRQFCFVFFGCCCGAIAVLLFFSGMHFLTGGSHCVCMCTSPCAIFHSVIVCSSCLLFRYLLRLLKKIVNSRCLGFRGTISK